MNKAEEAVSLKKKLESLRSQRDRLEGSWEQLSGRLEREFGVATLKEGNKLLARKRKELEGLEEEVSEKVEQWESKWGEKLSN